MTQIDTPTEQQPALVPKTQQAGDAHILWTCAKPCVWTVRMLTALIKGVEGGVWFRLIDKVFSERNLLAAYRQVASKKGAPGVDHVSVEQFGERQSENIRQLSSALKSSEFTPQSIRRVDIPRPGTTETRPRVAQPRSGWVPKAHDDPPSGPNNWLTFIREIIVNVRASCRCVIRRFHSQFPLPGRHD